MKINDAIIGFILVLFGAAVGWRARDFPTLPSQHYGASLFPTIIGIGLVGCGLVLIVSGLMSKAASGDDDRWLRLGEWVKSPYHVVSVLMVPLGLVFYILVAGRLGFFLTSTLLLFSWIIWLRGRWLSALALAVVVTFIIDFGFSRLLLVPLPWGVFQPLAWL